MNFPLPTFVFFFALVFSIIYIIRILNVEINYFRRHLSKEEQNSLLENNSFTSVIFTLVVSGLWSWLFYLTH